MVYQQTQGGTTMTHRHGGHMENEMSDGQTQITQITHMQLGGTDECIKLVKEFNTETARFHDLILSLGGSSDSEMLREELKKTRQRACELAQDSKKKLVPHLKDSLDFKSENETNGDYERLWNTFTACVDLFEGHMKKSLELERAFPIHKGRNILINTGVMEPLGVENIPVNVENLDYPTVDKMVVEREDIHLLERDILELRNLMSEMQRRVDIKPWMIEPPADYKIEYAKSRKSVDSDCGSSDGGVEVPFAPTQRKNCIVMVVVALIMLVAFTVVLTVCLAKFNPNT
ncbi:regulator of G-protein signaling 9-binding protein-like [Amphiura filiformis]|uniref:regulator of G-protein signaling 9-binding protein-like n=1 Tax=Amphiura filiformis TaxID=82378 RepID=UPI003B212A62